MSANTDLSTIEDDLRWKTLFTQVKEPPKILQIFNGIDPTLNLKFENCLAEFLKSLPKEQQVLIEQHSLISVNIRPPNLSDDEYKIIKQDLFMETQSAEAQYQYFLANENERHIKWLIKAAQKNHAEAQCLLGYWFKKGTGTFEKIKDYDLFIYWTTKAAKQNHRVAQYNLGGSLWFGMGKDKNEKSGFEWLLKSALQGYAEAEYNIGLIFLNGSSEIKKDEKYAFEWLSKSAMNGCASAQNSLGNCYYNGIGVATDKIAAVIWYKSSAKQNFASAQYNLAHCFQRGIGVEKDTKKAIEWYNKAHEQNIPLHGIIVE